MHTEASRLVIGISSCLLGQQVRFDGGHRRDDFLLDLLGPHVEWTPVCPEIEIGLGTPRESLRLAAVSGEHRLIATKSQQDLSTKMEAYAQRKMRVLDKLNLDGYVLKKNSPSCGMERVRLYNAAGVPTAKGVGAYARVLMAHAPLLPVEEEGRLHDSGLRENFIERVFAYHRWRQFLAAKPPAKALIDFHTRQKLGVMAHSPVAYRELGQWVAQAGLRKRDELFDGYSQRWMAALQIMATPKKHANVLSHVMGYFKKVLDEADKRELAETIENYRVGLFPLIVPITLLKHYLRKHPVEWIERQTYLDPYPAQLRLRNTV